MATFKICVRKQRNDGFYPVYIRIIHRRQTAFMKTDKMVDKKGLNRSGDIKDTIILSYCSDRINNYIERLNKEDISEWTIKDVVSFLEKGDTDVCFSDYARKYKLEMAKRGQERNARNYELSYQHLERFAGTNKLMFSRFTTKFMNDWFASLSNTARAKEMYPVCIRQIFKAAINEFNDYDRGVIRIKTNPWPKVKIPTSDKPDHKAISAEEIKRFFELPLPPTKMISSVPEIARDVAMMVMCLAGINTVDLYYLKKSNYNNGILSYNRRKTAKFRADKAHLEIRVPEILKGLFEKYKAGSEDEYLFSFHERYSSEDAISSNVNGGLRKICSFNELPISYCIYTFRHSWGTIARNDIKASMYDVAFSMNHSSAHKVTETYVKPDYSIVSDLNQKVIDYIFFGKRTENNNVDDDQENESHFKISFKNMIMGTVFFNEKKIYSFKDLGYNNIDDVITELAKHLPEDMPVGCKAIFRVDNLDKGDFRIYERQKGKGF
ncbi:tyrosine-type recombinase/integrase [Parabacteroides provencensis]|uniref:tyrosine-type recombinase/integrase n=1 Tax=Parabacteroides provencensis TaxID=1944636 RepID=UPI000C154B98|nr:phage integrase SAM-like domain-containing protein [Parabacteroides provencensis]